MARRAGAAAAAAAREGSDEPVVRGRSGLDLKLWLMPASTVFGLVALNAIAGRLPYGLFVLQIVSSALLAVAAGVLVPVFAFVISLPPVHDRTVAFFHPFADGGGGGERVLWEAVRALQRSRPDLQVAIYCGWNEGEKKKKKKGKEKGGVEASSASASPPFPPPTESSLRAEARRRFGIQIRSPLMVVPIKYRERLLPERYRFATALRQALASIRLTAQALARLRPAAFVDTTGWAFGYPLARLAGCRVVAYVHYPTVSADMVRRVRAREAGFNNGGFARTALGARLKAAYYGLLRHAYGHAGRCASVVFANSTWTAARVRDAWWRQGGDDVRLLYPPADVAGLEAAAAKRREERGGAGAKAAPPLCVYVAQFRPEKGHETLLDAIVTLRAWAQQREPRGGDEASAGKGSTRSAPRPATELPFPPDLPVPFSPSRVLAARFAFVGGCRDAADAARADALEAEARARGVPPSALAFERDVPSDRLRELLLDASVGLHAMRDEHFGIGVVEGCAAGAVPVAHDSGGPKEDIVVPAPDDWWASHLDGRDETDAQDDRDAADAPTGMLCSSPEEYARALAIALSAPPAELALLAANAQRRVRRFDASAFRAGFVQGVAAALPPKPTTQ